MKDHEVASLAESKKRYEAVENHDLLCSGGTYHIESESLTDK